MILYTLAPVIICFIIAIIVNNAMNSIGQNSNSADSINKLLVALLGSLELFVVVLLIPLFKMEISGEMTAIALALNAIPQGIVGKAWAENLSKNPEGSFGVLGYFSLSCIELVSLVLLKNIFVAKFYETYIISIAIAVNAIGVGIILYGMANAIRKNPLISGDILKSVLPFVGAIEVSGLVLAMKLFTSL